VTELNTARKPLNFILIKPAGPDCNMACTYCFYYDKTALFSTGRHRMREETLEKTLSSFLASAHRPVTVGWQGGEPGLMGISFFEKAVDLERKYAPGVQVGNSFQTNGYHLDRAWARFFHKNRFLVGLSLDGPAHVHDRYRLTRDGRGTWQRVTDNLKMLLDQGVAVNTMTVVNDYSVRFPEEIYNFHKELGIRYMQFIPCVEADPSDPSRAAPFSVSARAYGEFLCKLFDLWVGDFRDGIPEVSIRFFDSVLLSYLDLPPEECTFNDECGVYLVVEHNGDVYPCDFFVEPALKLGNVYREGLEELLNSEQQKQFGRAKAEMHRKCLRCPWLRHCKGGCPKDRLRDPRDRGMNHFCESYKIFYRYADSRLKKMALHLARVLGIRSPGAAVPPPRLSR